MATAFEADMEYMQAKLFYIYGQTEGKGSSNLLYFAGTPGLQETDQ